MGFKNLPSFAANLACAIFCADFLTMLAMNLFRLYTHWLPILFFALLLVLGFWIFRSDLIASSSPHWLSPKQQLTLVAIVVAAGVLFACVRIPYLLEGHLHHLVGPVVYDDTWHFEEINSLVNSLRYPAHFSLVPHAYFSLYYAPWVLIAALYLALPAAGFTIKAAFAVGCAIYQVLICLTLLHIAIAKARSQRQLYWAVYLVGFWAGLESFFAALYYIRHDAWWLRISETPIHFPIFGSGMVWAVHHMSAAAALLLCWYIWDSATVRNWRVLLSCSLLIAFAFYGSIFVFLGALPFGIVAVCLSIRERWKATLTVACLSAALIWPLLWLYLGKSSDVRFLFPFIGSVHALLPGAPAITHHRGMWLGFLVFLVLLCLNFLPYTVAVAWYGKRFSRSSRIFALLSIAFLVSTYFIGFQEGDNYASRGYLIPIMVFAWVCAGVLPSIRSRKWVAVLLLLGAFGVVHEAIQLTKRAIYISRTPCAGSYDAQILAINRDRHIRIVDAPAWRSEPGIVYNMEKFIASGKSKLVTADRQLESPGPRGAWRWQQIPEESAK